MGSNRGINGYQQGILMALGCWQGDRFSVRSIDRWYCDAVAHLFPASSVYSQNVRGRESKQHVIKSSRVKPPDLCEVVDWQGFCRAWIEIHALIDLSKRLNRNGTHYYAPRLRIYGSSKILEKITAVLPANPKKIQHIKNNFDGYVGETNAIYYQSKKEIINILEWIDGEPRNESIWAKWQNILT